MFWCVVYDDGIRKSILVHREIMEEHLKRSLRPDEVVHHKDGNPTNNKITNLEVMLSSEHSKHHGSLRPAEILPITCLECGKSKLLSAKPCRHNRKQGKEGPFCGRACASKWIQRKQGLGPFKHGGSTGYDYHGCRCDVCTEYHRLKQKAYRDRRQTK